MAKKINVLVCGSKFGEYYLKALSKLEKEFNIVGILSKGSERSLKLSKDFKVPNYTNVQDLPQNIDLACVVVRSRGLGGEGTRLCMELMEKGISVIQEQPVHKEDWQDCYMMAQKQNVLYTTADLYMHLPSIKTFIDSMKFLNHKSKLEHISISVSTQVAYTAFDILGVSELSNKLILNEKVIKLKGPFDIVYGLLGNIPIIIEFNNRININNPDHNMYVMHNFRFYYDDGTLSLNDTFGPVSWRPRIYINSDIYGKNIREKPHFEEIYESKSSIKKIFNSTWIEAIMEELLEIRNYIIGSALPIGRLQREIETVSNWEKLTHVSGYSDFVQEDKETYLNFPEEIYVGKGNKNDKE